MEEKKFEELLQSFDSGDMDTFHVIADDKRDELSRMFDEISEEIEKSVCLIEKCEEARKLLISVIRWIFNLNYESGVESGNNILTIWCYENSFENIAEMLSSFSDINIFLNREWMKEEGITEEIVEKTKKVLYLLIRKLKRLISHNWIVKRLFNVFSDKLKSC